MAGGPPRQQSIGESHGIFQQGPLEARYRRRGRRSRSRTACPSSPASLGTAPVIPPPPQPIALVDEVAQLELRAAACPLKLNWRTSIVDLLKLLEIDSSFTARKELARELGCPVELMGDFAKMNMWLHKTLHARIAANGGNVPKDLLD